jgi:hypothetical protein
MSNKNEKTLPAPTDDNDRMLLVDVREHGWHVIMVAADEEGPAFAYSIGLFHNFDHPEVIIFGLGIRDMHQIINGIGEQIRVGGKFGDLDESGDVLESYNVIFRSTARKHYRQYLGYASWFYQGDQFPVLQCVWPDSEHQYPWHPLFNQKLAVRQPVLSDDKSWPFQAGGNRAVFTTKPVTQKGHPVLQVFHDQEGDWQFLCGSTNQMDDMQLVSLGSMVQRDPSLANLADLPEGWYASRDAVGKEWTREPMEQE